jgi:hypothetical protein
MNIESNTDKEVNYKFHNNASFVQIELGLEEEDIDDDVNLIDLNLIWPTLQALNSPNRRIGDIGATKHSSKHKQGGINLQPPTSRTRGIFGQAVKPAMELDFPGAYCNKNSKDKFAVKLLNLDVIPERHYNLISIMRLMETGHKVTGNKNDGITVQNGAWVIKFDMRVETLTGELWCAYIMHPEPDGKIAAGVSNGNPDKQHLVVCRKNFHWQ